MALQFIDNIDITGKKIIARFDFNVPLKDGEILDSTRIDLALPTIRYMLENGASQIVMMSHLGRPKGQPQEKYSLAPIASYLAEKLDKDIILTQSPTDGGIKDLLKLKETKILLLENLRFDAREEENDTEFARKLSTYGDIYLNDAFGASHRKHASIHRIIEFYNMKNVVGGFLVKKELQALDKITERPVRPFYALLGGAKISDKIKTIERLLITVDKILIGGAMAYPFLKAFGHEIGQSLCSSEDVALAEKILKTNKRNKILLPLDHIVSDGPDGEATICGKQAIPADKMGLDIGPQTQSLYRDTLINAKTIFWNGPMGLFERPQFSKGSFTMAQALSECEGFTFVGGGDSVSAVNKSQKQESISHISTGGGASLEYIEKGELPGIQALKFGLL